ncbi:MAG: hypothetical protein JNN07_21840 [Verrucomicrobiales bacterium]|nr:hypothetical protein [Verrucomicrobiales bacterium]
MGRKSSKAESRPDVLIGLVGAAGRSLAMVESKGTRHVLEFGPLAMRVNRDLQADLEHAFHAIALRLKLRSVAELASNTRSACVAMSGIFDDSEKRVIRRFLTEMCFADDQVNVCEDVCATMAAHRIDYGGLITVSTGSNVAFFASLQKYVSVGCWGSELADQGSGYYLGREALIRIIDSKDGRRSATDTFKNEVLQHLGLAREQEIVHWFYEVRDTNFWRKRIADIAIVISHLAKTGDTTARQILECGRAEIIKSVKAGLDAAARSCLKDPSRNSESPLQIVLAGALAKQRDCYRNVIIKEVERFFNAFQTHAYPDSHAPLAAGFTIIDKPVKAEEGALTIAKCARSFRQDKGRIS